MFLINVYLTLLGLINDFHKHLSFLIGDNLICIGGLRPNFQSLKYVVFGIDARELEEGVSTGGYCALHRGDVLRGVR